MTHLTNAYNLFFSGMLSLYFPRVKRFGARLINLGCCELFSELLSESESYVDKAYVNKKLIRSYHRFKKYT